MDKPCNQTGGLLPNLCVFVMIFYSANFTIGDSLPARSLSECSMEWVGHGQRDQHLCGALSADFNHLAGRG